MIRAAIDAFRDAIMFPPEFVYWSGVREAEFAARPEALLAPEGGEAPVPFQFMLQIAFTSAPAFLERKPEQESEDVAYSDTKPWEFPALEAEIQKKVLAELAKPANASDREAVADVSEFAMLQRLFRMAFDGRLGESFPVERLAELEKELAPKGPPSRVRTLRWNARPGALEASLVAQLRLVTNELDKPDRPAEAQSKRTQEARAKIDDRVTRLKGFITHYQEHLKALDHESLGAAERDRLWGQWEAWRSHWFADWAGLGALPKVPRRAGADTSKPLSNDELMSIAAGFCEHYESTAKLRVALNIARDERQGIEELRSAFPALDP